MMHQRAKASVSCLKDTSDMQAGGAGTRTADVLVSERRAPPPQPQPPVVFHLRTIYSWAKWSGFNSRCILRSENYDHLVVVRIPVSVYFQVTSQFIQSHIVHTKVDQVHSGYYWGNLFKRPNCDLDLWRSTTKLVKGLYQTWSTLVKVSLRHLQERNGQTDKNCTSSSDCHWEDEQ